MKKKSYPVVAGIAVFLLLAAPAVAQLSPERMKEFVGLKVSDTRGGTKNPILVKEFYTLLGFETVWLGKENKVNLDDLSALLQQAGELGLEEEDYQVEDMVSYRNGSLLLNTISDSLEAELHFTDAAIHFSTELMNGNVQPVFGYNGLNYSPDCRAIPGILASYISSHNLKSLIPRLNQGLPEIHAIEKQLGWLQKVMADSNFREVIINSPAGNGKNKPLVRKLYQLGLLDTDTLNLPDSLLKRKVKEAQRQFSLLDDGILHPTILGELNKPLYFRLRQLKLSLNYYRWLYWLTRNQQVIVVNIPAAYLKVYRDNNVILEMRMILGKKSTPTPTLASRVNEVILYPYWHVPHRIAVKELLPSIKKNPGFIEAGNFQVLDKSGKIMDPYSINWQAFSINYFPYLIRQSTGCDNALGLLKLNFYNSYGVYLHDTPTRDLFLLNRRYFSHGCMRMEKPVELGHLVLKNNPIAIDTLEEKGCLRNQSPITVPADEHMPVIVWYNPAGIDSTGRVIFYEDIYRKLDWMKKEKVEPRSFSSR